MRIAYEIECHGYTKTGNAATSPVMSLIIKLVLEALIIN